MNLMDELEALRRKKMQEYSAMQNTHAQMEQARQAESMAFEIKKLISQILSKDAMQRLSNIRAIKPEMAHQIELYLLEMYRAGQIKPPLTDADFKKMLDKLILKKETKIIRKPK